MGETIWKKLTKTQNKTITFPNMIIHITTLHGMLKTLGAESHIALRTLTARALSIAVAVYAVAHFPCGELLQRSLLWPPCHIC